jgi:hypothetical protein
MNWNSQLTNLIFDFYREDPEQLQKIQVLKQCKLSRRWGVLRIRCKDFTAAQSLAAVSDILIEPIAQLRIAREVRLMSNRILIGALPVSAPKLFR